MPGTFLNRGIFGYYISLRFENILLLDIFLFLCKNNPLNTYSYLQNRLFYKKLQIVTATGQRGLNSGPVRAMDSGQLRT